MCSDVKRERGCQHSLKKRRQAYVACRRCRGCRQRQMSTTSLHGLSSSFVDLKRMKKTPRLAIASEGVGGFASEGRNPPRLAVACKGVGFCHPVLRCHCQ